MPERIASLFSNTPKGVSKKSADKTILRDWQDARNARRYPWLVTIAYAAKAILWLGFLPVFLVPQSFVVDYVLGWMAVAALYLIWILSRAVRWASHGRRLKMFYTVLGFVAFLALVTGLLTWLT